MLLDALDVVEATRGATCPCASMPRVHRGDASVGHPMFPPIQQRTHAAPPPPAHTDRPTDHSSPLPTNDTPSSSSSSSLLPTSEHTARVRMASPSRLHKRTVLSRDPVAMVLPSGEKATLLTSPVWPYSGMRGIRHRLVHTPRTKRMAGPCAGAPPRSCSTPRHPPAPQHTATPTPLPPPTAAPDTPDGIFSRPPTKGPPRRWSSVSHHLFTQARYGQFLGEEMAENGA